MNQFELSFIIPCLNSEKTIEQTIVSILSQKTFINYKVIVVDNGSTDKTINIVNNFKNIENYKENKIGANHARNLGAKYAEGSYLAFIDSDVILDEFWLQNLIDYMKIKNLDAAQGLVIRKPAAIPRFLDYYRCFDDKNPTNWTDFVTRDYQVGLINTAACIYRKDTFQKVLGFSRVLKMHEDVDLTYKVMALPNSSLGCTTQSIAYCYYTGNFLSYIKRSIKAGYYRSILNKKWRIFPKDKSTSPRILLSKDSFKFLFISNLVVFFSKLGHIYGKIFVSIDSNVLFISEKSWHQNIMRLPKSTNYKAYFDNDEISFNHKKITINGKR